MSIQNQECPNCTGPLRFDPELGKMVCDFCCSEFEMEPQTPNEPENKAKQSADVFKEQPMDSPEAVAYPKPHKKKAPPVSANLKNQMKGFDFHLLLTQAESEDAQKLPVYNCSSCGAEIIAADAQFSLTCPFCKSNVVLTDKVSGNLRPDGIIPFKITPDKLHDATKKYYRKQKYIPKRFFSENVMSKITGIYVPFWVFDGSAEGKLYYRGETFSSKSRSGDYIVENYAVYDLERDVSLSFKDIPIDASEKMDDALMDSIAPFDMNEVKPFDTGYLAGFAADRFDVPARNIAGRAKGRMIHTLSLLAEAKATSGYSSVRSTGSNLNANMNAKYILMPIYQFHLEYDSKKYTFAVNGQTGKMAGNLPYDDNKANLFAYIRFGIIAAALIGVSVVRYLLGG